MKKGLIFASILAVVALLAVSCKEKVEAPKARFSYSADGLVVTFQNLSENADKYAWDFGDGETSTEKDPIHEYKEFGSYNVKMTATNAGGSKSYEDEVELIKRIIEVDGDFADWTAADAKVVKLVADDNAKEDYFYSAKMIRDKDFIYFYLEFSPEKDEFDVEDVGLVTDYYVKHVSLWLNMNDETGCDIWWWASGAHIDFLIEGSWEDQFASASIEQCPAELNGGNNEEWQWDNTGVIGAVSSSEAKTLDNQHLAIEGKIMVGLLPIQASSVIKMGIGALAPDWETYAGRLPQTTLTDQGTEELGVLPAVPLAE